MKNLFLKGKTLLAKKNQMFVQTWRAKEWGKEKLDSILTFVFRPIESGTELEMIHANVPDDDAESVKKGWNDYYWKPWQDYIKKTK